MAYTCCWIVLAPLLTFMIVWLKTMVSGIDGSNKVVGDGVLMMCAYYKQIVVWCKHVDDKIFVVWLVGAS